MEKMTKVQFIQNQVKKAIKTIDRGAIDLDLGNQARDVRSDHER